jgi:hypothetical protein
MALLPRPCLSRNFDIFGREGGTALNIGIRSASLLDCQSGAGNTRATSLRAWAGRYPRASHSAVILHDVRLICCRVYSQERLYSDPPSPVCAAMLTEMLHHKH